jgi:hypothetical protein
MIGTWQRANHAVVAPPPLDLEANWERARRDKALQAVDPLP